MKKYKEFVSINEASNTGNTINDQFDNDYSNIIDNDTWWKDIRKVFDNLKDTLVYNVILNSTPENLVNRVDKDTDDFNNNSANANLPEIQYT